MPMTPFRTFLDDALAAQIERLARTEGRSESSVIADAVRSALSARSGRAADTDISTNKRQLNRMEERLNRLAAEHTTLKKVVLTFVRIWLEHNPPINPEHADSAALMAEARFQRFVELAVRGFADTSDGSGDFDDAASRDFDEDAAA